MGMPEQIEQADDGCARQERGDEILIAAKRLAIGQDVVGL
jgi:hypothetical protein